MRVVLHINHESGKFDERSLVASFTIPPFKPSPDVLVWGTRVFTALRNHRPEPITDGEGRAIYTEAFSYYIVQKPE